ncbi:hypothetical protein LIER_34569 [Lithospermum erythrorhizon]|uniref:Uncharacterized protein n=1 Tax=Lithospermum erythrorhizon TaxID=34254 RepID=A0AAV3RZV9_LITER
MMPEIENNVEQTVAQGAPEERAKALLKFVGGPIMFTGSSAGVHNFVAEKRGVVDVYNHFVAPSVGAIAAVPTNWIIESTMRVVQSLTPPSIEEQGKGCD